MTAEAAVFLDCDNTLVRTEPVWELAERAAVEALGATWLPRLHTDYGGWSTEETARRIAIYARRPDDHAYAHEVMLDTYDRALVDGLAEPMPGALDLVRALSKRSILTAVVSNSPSRQVETALEQTGLRIWVNLVVCAGQEGLNPKPAADLYDHAIRTLRADRARSFGIEDTDVGIAALRAAGLFAVLAPNAAPGLDGDHRLESLHPLDLDELFRLADRR
jgi:HAD superfamily hydrolase (TIGR01509 family)